MPVFAYKAMQADGAATEGSIEAGGRQDAARTLESRGLTPLRLTERDGAPANAARALKAPTATPGRALFQSKRVTFDALEDFTRSLSSLLAANVPRSRSCSSPSPD